MSFRLLNLEDPEFKLWDTSYPNEGGCSIIEATFSPKHGKIKCPRCHASGKYIVKDGIDKAGKKKWDIVNGRPAQVILHAQLWRCKACGNKGFPSSEYPYAGKERTTEAFDKWLGQKITDDLTVNQRDLANEYGISVSIVNNAFKKKLEETGNHIEIAVPVKTVWLVPFNFHKKKHLAIFGQHITDKDYCYAMRLEPNSDDVVFFGISQEYSLEGARKGGRLLITDDIETVYCPYELFTPELKKRYKVFDSTFATYPEQINKVLKLISIFGKKRYSSNQLELLLMYRDDARREELRRKGETPFRTDFVFFALQTYKKSYSLFDFAMWNDYDILVYSIDIDLLLKIYGLD